MRRLMHNMIRGHVDKADKTCDKGGYDGYIGGDCGYLNLTKVSAAPFIILIFAIRKNCFSLVILVLLELTILLLRLLILI